VKKNKLIIIGDSSFAEVAYEYFTHDSDYEVCGFAVERKFIEKKELFGLPIVALEDITDIYQRNMYDVFVALTYTNLNYARERIYKDLKNMGYSFATYISSQSFVWKNVEIGENCFIFEDNTIQPFVKIGNNTIIWSGNHIGHHGTIGNNVFISSHVVVSGHVTLKDNCFFGVNSTIGNNVSVEKDCWIGPNCLITHDTKQGQIYRVRQSEPSRINAYDYFKVNR